MQRVGLLLLLLLLSLCLVHGAPDQSTPDLLSIVTQLQSQVQTLQAKVRSSQSQVQTLKDRVTGLESQLLNGSRVAFFVGLHADSTHGDFGPFNVSTTVVFKRVLTNIGNGYNAETGVFSAPVRGLYVFHFTMFTSPANPNVMAALQKNNVNLAISVDKSAADTSDASTRVAVVTLEAGDQVFVKIQAQSYCYDTRGRLSSFSGFLLSAM